MGPPAVPVDVSCATAPKIIVDFAVAACQLDAAARDLDAAAGRPRRDRTATSTLPHGDLDPAARDLDPAARGYWQVNDHARVNGAPPTVPSSSTCRVAPGAA